MTSTTAANRLRELRTARNLSLATLGERIGVHESTVSRWESGESGIPDWRKEQIASIFGVSVPFMMGWADPDDDGGGVRMAA